MKEAHVVDLPIATRRRYVHVNGVRLHVVEAGPVDGDLVVLLHGFPEFWYGWRHQIPALADAGYRVVVPDQRGYNESDRPRSVAAYDLGELVQDVVELIEAIGRPEAVGTPQAHVVGHDWGAVVAWALATWAPERVRSLSILNVPHPAVFQKTLRSDVEQLKKSWYVLFFQLPRLPEWLLGRDGAGGLVRMMKGSARPDTFTDADLAIYREAWTRPDAIRAMIHWYRAAARRALFGEPVRGPIDAPTQVIWGVQDVALSVSMARPSAARAGGRLTLIDDATHWVQHDAPDRVNELLLDHLSA